MRVATALFYQKGFHNTSVRDIANKASVNVSSVSYYFQGKQGLLEATVTEYYEAYLLQLEESMHMMDHAPPLDYLKKLISTIIQYKQNNFQFSCFIHRELSFDSVFAREMVVTYLAKENHYIADAFFKAIENARHTVMDRQFLLMQLKGMLSTPYIMHSELKNQVIGDYSHELFATQYAKTIHNWLDFVVATEELSYK